MFDDLRKDSPANSPREGAVDLHQAAYQGKEHRNSRHEEISNLLKTQIPNELPLKSKVDLAVWLSENFERLSTFASNGELAITREAVADAYASKHWDDKTKISSKDTRNLKLLAGHFDQIALGGATKDKIEKSDITALLLGATVTRKESTVIVRYPDGDSLETDSNAHISIRRGADGTFDAVAPGVKAGRAKDGTVTYEWGDPSSDGSSSMKMTLRPDGSGEMLAAGQTMPIKRKAGNMWILTDPNGGETEISIDEHSARVAGPEGLRILGSSSGILVTDTASGGMEFEIKPDGSISAQEGNEKLLMHVSKDYTVSSDTKEGHEIRYPNGVNYVKDSDGNVTLFSEKENYPIVKVSAQGALSIENDRVGPAISGIELPDHSKRSQMKDGTKVLLSPDGTVDLRVPKHFGPYFVYEYYSLKKDGQLTFMDFHGRKRRYVPWEIEQTQTERKD
jgi:hypothetical protein